MGTFVNPYTIDKWVPDLWAAALPTKPPAQVMSLDAYRARRANFRAQPVADDYVPETSAGEVVTFANQRPSRASTLTRELLPFVTDTPPKGPDVPPDDGGPAAARPPAERLAA